MDKTFKFVVFGLVAKELTKAGREKDEAKVVLRINNAIKLLKSLLTEDETEMSALASVER